MAQHAARGMTKWIGWILFLGLVMMISGLISVIQGLVALLDDDFYRTPSTALAINVNYTAWGWTLLLFGLLLLGTGYAVMFGYAWARLIAMVVVAAHAFVNLAFLAAYPIWSIISIGLDLIAIYALAVHGGEAKLLRRERT